MVCSDFVFLRGVEMAHFAAVINEQEWFIDMARLENDVRLLITGAGHTYESWRPETAEISLHQFLVNALSLEMPVAIIYMGHSSENGWVYATCEKFEYIELAKCVAAQRIGRPTAIINDCCHASSIGQSFQKTSFDRKNTIALTAGIATRPSSSGETFESHHTYRVLDTWFNKKKPFNPFEWDDSVKDIGEGGEDSWEHWIREGPERFGPEEIDWYFINT